jgi:undecaprenyl-diphosphatase
MPLAVVLYCATAGFCGPVAAADGIPMPQSEAIAYGIIQGITEFLPISSSAHLMVAGEFFGRSRCGDVPPRNALWHFDLFLQFASALAVIVAYRVRIIQLCRGLFGRSRDGLRLLALLAVAFLPGATCGIFVDRFHLGHMSSAAVLGWPLLAGGIYIICFERFRKNRRQAKDLSDLGAAESLFIGAMQAVALIPGVSRSLMSISACLLIGLTPVAAVEFSFLLGAGTIFAATCYGLLGGGVAALCQIPFRCLLAGSVASFIFALAAIGIFRRLLITKSLVPFAYYRIAVGLLILSAGYLPLT